MSRPALSRSHEFRRPRHCLVGLLSLVLLASSGSWTPNLQAAPQTPAEPEGLSGSQAEAILQELREIRRLLERIDKQQGAAQAPLLPQRLLPRPPTTARVSVADHHPALGAADAPVTVVEFTDYECPFCLRFVQGTFSKLKEQYIDTGKVRWVVRDLPMGFHRNARKAAQAAHCAGDQGKFWEMRTVLFANARQLERDKLPKYAQIIGLDQDAFVSCLASDKYMDAIDRDVQEASSVKISGTPTFVIGKSRGDTVEGARVVGAREYQVFANAIQKALEDAGAAQGGTAIGRADGQPSS